MGILSAVFGTNAWSLCRLSINGEVKDSTIDAILDLIELVVDTTTMSRTVLKRILKAI